MEELLEPDVYKQLRRLIESPQPLVETLSHYSHTLLHGDYRVENLAYLDTPDIIDWQEASRSLMTIDLAWIVRKGYVQESLGQVQVVGWLAVCWQLVMQQDYSSVAPRYSSDSPSDVPKTN